MCGIVGFVKEGDDVFLRKTLSKSLDTIRHRGPDAKGIYVNGPVYLGHARLHILDSSEKSNQPFVSSDGNYVITYNGELYNYQGIRKTLETNGFVFKTETDTEVILCAYQNWGESCVKRFSGMFAFAIYDLTKKTLFLARDIFGEKPLYYSNEKGFSFCSELEAFKIVCHDVKINIEALNHFLAIGYILNPLTPLQGVHLLPPATYLSYSLDSGTVNTSRYFDYASCFAHKTRLSEEEAGEQVLRLLQKSVTERVTGPFDFGLFLSGGIDSSSISAVLKDNGQAFPCFNVSFPGSVYDESEKAEAISSHLNLELKTVALGVVPPTELTDYFNTIDYATFDNSSFAMFRLAQRAKQEVQYVMTGDGADECFGGYITYKADRIAKKLRLIIPILKQLERLGIFPLLLGNRNDKVGFNTKATRFLNGLSSDYRKSHYNWRGLFSPKERIALLGGEFAELILDTDPFHGFMNYYNQVSHLSEIDQHLFVDSQTWLTDNVLIKTDRNTMLSGLEARSPFLDKELVSFLASCSASLKNDKRLLKTAMRSLLPKGVIQQKKSGFNAPILSWFDADIRQDEFKYYTEHLFNFKYSNR